MGPGIHDFEHDPIEFDRLILVGPIWTGQLIAPIRAAIRKYKDEVDAIYFITCCGSRDIDKDDKYGYNTVFQKAQEVADGRLTACHALPVSLVLPEDMREDNDAIMNARLCDENFRGEILKRFEAFLDEVETQRELV